MPFVAHRALGHAPIKIDETWGLKTVPIGIAYTLCHSTFCSNCSFLFLDMRFSERELSSLYEGYREKEYTKLREHYEPGYKNRNDILTGGVTYLPQIEEFLTPFLTFPIKTLDWGGDTGRNTPFKTKNSLLHIYEINNKQPIQGAKVVDKKIILKTSYDLIVCSNVLEHVPYPSDLLLEIKEAMNPETILYLEVPFEEIMQHANGDKNLHLKKRHWHEHINFYSEESLRRLVANCGFDVIALNNLNA
ncbi:MAG: class I SAM-dependent methyltransferase [Verrucomicrobia bacterium]|nr:class I SAM-dependent methyltransferase [Verrucomicrobiota bacterium]